MRIRFPVLAFVAAAGVPHAAGAADIPPPIHKAPVAVVAPGPSWTGFYVNAGVGYGLWTAELFTSAIPGFGAPVLPVRQQQGGRGYLGRIGGGFDYQFTSRIVGGVFGDYEFSDLKGTIHDPIATVSAEIKQTYAWAVGARVGWLINPSLLSYLTAGYTSTHFSSGSMVSFAAGGFGPIGAATGFTTPAFTASGWFLGGGAETAIGGGWYGRTEYRYAYYGDQVLPDTGPSPFVPFAALNNIHFKPTVQTVTSSIVYKFNPGVAGATADGSSTVAARWSGLYANVGVGYGLWVADETTTLVAGPAPVTNPPVLVTQRQGGKGWLGRVGAGYDYQFTPKIVVGVFGDADFSSLKGSLQNAAGGLDGQTKQDWAWAAGARVGWLIAPDTMTYVNAGYAEAHFTGTTLLSMQTQAQFFGASTSAFTVDGYFLGGGVEAALAPGWFWRSEYRMARYDTASVPTNSPIPASFIGNTINFKPQVQTVVSELIYKFNWGG